MHLNRGWTCIIGGVELPNQQCEHPGPVEPLEMGNMDFIFFESSQSTDVNRWENSNHENENAVRYLMENGVHHDQVYARNHG